MAVITFWGKLGDIVGAGTRHVAVPASVSDTVALRAWLDGELSTGGALLDPANRIAIDNEIVAEPAPVADQCEIAFLPPVGGG